MQKRSAVVDSELARRAAVRREKLEDAEQCWMYWLRRVPLASDGTKFIAWTMCSDKELPHDQRFVRAACELLPAKYPEIFAMATFKEANSRSLDSTGCIVTEKNM